MITIKEVHFDFGTKNIFRGLSARLDEKKLTAIIGPNGAGKTTLLKMLAGILEPTGGSIIHDRIRTARDLMWLPSRIEMPFAYSVRDVIAMLLHPWVKDKAGNTRTMVADALAAAGLQQFGERVFSSLSAGEQHRIALGAAVVSDAKILILDEPCANLDIGAAHQILIRLRQVLDAGKSLVISIHDLQLAWEYCDDFLLLAPGDHTMQGTGKQVFSSETLSKAFNVSVDFVRAGERELPVFGLRHS